VPLVGITPIADDFARPENVAVDRAGNVYVADIDTNEITRVGTDGETVVLYAGDTAAGESNTYGVAVAPDDSVWFSNHTGVFKLEGSSATPVLTGEHLTGAPFGLAFDETGNLFVSELAGQRVLKLGLTGELSLVAGNGETAPQEGGAGDGGDATEAQLGQPVAVAVDADGNVYIAEGFTRRVRRVTPDGTITTFAGGGEVDVAAAADGTPAADVHFAEMSGVTVDADGNVYVADPGNDLVVRFDRTGALTRVAGGGASEVGGGAAPTDTKLDEPKGMTFDALGVMFFVDGVRVLRM
jgi:sugar lactone lactonase YvrE